MSDPKRIGDLTTDMLTRSNAFVEAQKKWNAKFNTNPNPELQKEYVKKVYAEKTEEPVTYEQAKKVFWFIAKQLEAEYEVNDVAKGKYPDLIKYFLSEGGLDLNKGILIYGNTGGGKTLFFKIIQQMLFNLNQRAFRICQCIDVEQSIRMGSDYSDFNLGVICFDDLGSEQKETLVFGNRVTVLSEILQLRYNSFQNNGLITHCTTNLTIEELEQRYGSRVIDRAKEMFNFVTFNWDSFRK